MVKGVYFVGLRDAGDPVAQAKIYDEAGADELVFLDISATPDGRATVAPMVRAVADEVFLPLTVGGGIRTVDDMRNILLAGADKVSINSSAVKTPELITQGAEKFGSQCVVVAIDAKKVISHQPSAISQWEVFISGGRVATGLDVIEWAKKVVALGAGEILLTSIDADGTKNGYDLELTRAVAESVNVPIIASGGAGAFQHFAEVLTKGKADAALAASLFHDGVMKVGEVKRYLVRQGVIVRMNNEQ